MNLDLTNKEIFAVVALVKGPDGKILTCSRRNAPQDLCMPGGKIDPGETPENAVCRELWEETGVEAETLTPIYAREDHTSLDRVCLIYEVTPRNPQDARTMEPGITVDWKYPSELLTPECTFGSYNRRLFAELGLA